MSSIDDLLAVMKSLRDPQSGCPWDRAQDMLSIAPYTIEEAYEVVEAIETGSPDEVMDELGDLLFHIIFYAEMASEKGQFDFDEICRHASNKLVRRHPHVFADEAAKDADAVAEDWEKMKAREKRESASADEVGPGLLDDISQAIPAMKRAEKLQKRAASVKFDWADSAPVFEKLVEEVEELGQVISKNEGAQRLEEELGDIIFSCVNLSRHLKIDAERALRRSNRKFASRFAHIESELKKSGRSIQQAEQQEMETLWEDAKVRPGS